METFTIPRKRGRPKKVAEVAITSDVPENVKRKNSTRTTTPKAASTEPKATSKPLKSAIRPEPAAASSSNSQTETVAISSSKILEEVAALKNASEESRSVTKTPTPSANNTKDGHTVNIPSQGKSEERVPPAQKSTESRSSFSPKQLNAFAVSHLSKRAHPSQSPPRIGNGQLPPGYKTVYRKYVSAMVALPIAIVTSYVLFDRLVLGHEQKQLIRDTPDPNIPDISGVKEGGND